MQRALRSQGASARRVERFRVAQGWNDRARVVDAEEGSPPLSEEDDAEGPPPLRVTLSQALDDASASGASSGNAVSASGASSGNADADAHFRESVRREVDVACAGFLHSEAPGKVSHRHLQRVFERLSDVAGAQTMPGVEELHIIADYLCGAELKRAKTAAAAHRGEDADVAHVTKRAMLVAIEDLREVWYDIALAMDKQDARVLEASRSRTASSLGSSDKFHSMASPDRQLSPRVYLRTVSGESSVSPRHRRGVTSPSSKLTSSLHHFLAYTGVSDPSRVAKLLLDQQGVSTLEEWKLMDQASRIEIAEELTSICEADREILGGNPVPSGLQFVEAFVDETVHEHTTQADSTIVHTSQSESTSGTESFLWHQGAPGLAAGRDTLAQAYMYVTADTESQGYERKRYCAAYRDPDSHARFLVMYTFKASAAPCLVRMPML